MYHNTCKCENTRLRADDVVRCLVSAFIVRLPDEFLESILVNNGKYVSLHRRAKDGEICLDHGSIRKQPFTFDLY